MGLSIQINPGIDPNTTSVIATGSLQHVITDNERSSFGLGTPRSRARSPSTSARRRTTRT